MKQQETYGDTQNILFNCRRLAIDGAAPAVRMVTKVALVTVWKSNVASLSITKRKLFADSRRRNELRTLVR